jgi:hypothetical protein
LAALRIGHHVSISASARRTMISLGSHQPKDRYELDGLDLIALMVDRRLGLSLLPDWVPPWP